MNITSNVLNRVFNISWNGSLGTGFAIDVDNKQYLITARHVVDEIISGDMLFILHDNQWKYVKVDITGIGEGEMDIAVLSCNQKLSVLNPVPTSVEFLYGQGVFFLGYPFGWNSGGEKVNSGLPFPFIKSGIISGVHTVDGVNLIYVDGHVNSGFSGGPLILDGDRASITGVVCGYKYSRSPVLDDDDNQVGYFGENPGIFFCIGIKHVLEIIEKNPNGF